MKLTDLDHQQIARYTYDEEHRALRMLNVTGQPVSIERAHSSPQIITETKIERIEVPVIVKEVSIERIEVPVIITEIKIHEVEKVIVVKEIERIEVPVITTGDQIQRVITKEVQVIEVDRINYKMLFAMQVITLILIVLSKYIK